MLNMVFLCFVVINLYCLLVVNQFYASVVESLHVFSCCRHFTTSDISGHVSLRFTTIGIKAMASKTTTTKFKMEKFDEKSNFLLWKMRVTSLLVKEGRHTQVPTWY